MLITRVSHGTTPYSDNKIIILLYLKKRLYNKVRVDITFFNIWTYNIEQRIVDTNEEKQIVFCINKLITNEGL